MTSRSTEVWLEGCREWPYGTYDIGEDREVVVLQVEVSKARQDGEGSW